MRRRRAPLASFRRSLRDDAGVSLLLALALVVCVGLIVGAIASYAGVSIATVNAGQEAVQRGYDVDGALQVAVDEVRVNEYDQDVNQPTRRCFGDQPDDDVLTVPGAGGEDVAVRCTPKPGTGADSGKVRITDDNRFADAIFTGSGGLEQNVQASVLVRGDLTSKAGIDVRGTPCAEGAGYPGGGTACGGLWAAEGNVHAEDPCSGTLVSIAGVKECSSSPPAAPPESSPTPGSSVTYRFVKPCPEYGARVEFEPGYYDDAGALSEVMRGCPHDEARTVVFRPGTYYFDFRNAEARAAPPGEPWPVLPGDDTWIIDNPNLTVIGGQESGDSFEDGACTSPMKHTGAQGVRFVFGRDSMLRIKQGKVSLCGTYSLTDKPIVIQGATSGVNDSTPPPQLGMPKRGESRSTSGGGFPPSDPEPLAATVQYENDGSTADQPLTRQPGGPHQLWAEFTGYFEQPVDIPAGSILKSATLELKHRESGALPGETVRVRYEPNGIGPVDPGPAEQPPTRETMTTDSIDLLRPHLVDEVHRHGLNGGKVRYELNSVAGTGNIDASLDLVRLTFTWIPPGIRQWSGATMLRTSDSTKFRVDGSIHAPGADLDLQLQGVNYLVVSAGIVARGVKLGIVPVNGHLGPVIQTPRISNGPSDLAVYLVAYACAGSCATPPPGSGWTPVGTASARFKDTDSVPGAPDREVTVDSWRIEP